MKPELVETILKTFPDAEHKFSVDIDEFLIDKADYLRLAEFLKVEPDMAFEHLSDLSGVDYLDYLEVVCHLYSYSQGHKLRLKTRITRNDPEVDSLTSLWGTANWQEREAWDHYGIVFTGHPDLRRIFCVEDQPGHLMRKDVPLENDEDWLLKDKKAIEEYGFPAGWERRADD